jgi:hypothetical protein
MQMQNQFREKIAENKFQEKIFSRENEFQEKKIEENCRTSLICQIFQKVLYFAGTLRTYAPIKD